MIQIAFVRFVNRETESLCAEDVGLKDIARSRRGELISRGELIMYCNERIILSSFGLRHGVIKNAGSLIAKINPEERT